MRPERFFCHTLTLARRTGTTAKGDPTFAAQTTFRARVERSSAFVINAKGEEVAAQHVVATSTVLGFEDLVWFPSILGEPADDTTSNSAARSPVSITGATNRRGTKGLWQVYF